MYTEKITDRHPAKLECVTTLRRDMSNVRKLTHLETQFSSIQLI